jgi:endonuclease YncB( thermonuclease family)
VFGLACLLIQAASAESSNAEFTVGASSVARGDWFMVETKGETKFFSLFDVECAPVTHPLGREAKALTRAVIADAALGLTVVERRTPTLARVAASLDGLSLSAILVSEGLAVIRPGIQAPEKLVAERDRARSLRLGFWSDYGVAPEALRGMEGRYGVLIEELERLHAAEILETRKRQLARLKEIQRVISDDEWRDVTTHVARILSPSEFQGVAWAYPSPSLENVGYYMEALGDWELGPAFLLESFNDFSYQPARSRNRSSEAVVVARIEENLERLRGEGRARNQAKRSAREAAARTTQGFFEELQSEQIARTTRARTPLYSAYPHSWIWPDSNLMVNGQWMPPWSHVFIITPGTGPGSRRRSGAVRPRNRRDEERRPRGSLNPRGLKGVGL